MRAVVLSFSDTYLHLVNVCVCVCVCVREREKRVCVGLFFMGRFCLVAIDVKSIGMFMVRRFEVRTHSVSACVCECVCVCMQRHSAALSEYADCRGLCEVSGRWKPAG